MAYLLKPRDSYINDYNRTRRYGRTNHWEDRERGRYRSEREREQARERDRERITEGRSTIPEEIKPLFTALQGHIRPVAHCVARSLQLINLDALTATGDRSAYSHICNYKFMDPHPSGLPAPGRPLSDSPGLKSLETLFYIFQNNAVQITDSNRQEYLQFMQQLGKIYGIPDGPARELKFKELVNNTDAQICSTLQLTKQVTPLTGREAEAAKGAVMKLWAKQLEHTREVDKIFSQMFLVDKTTRQIRISPNILHLGIPGLDAIGANARRLLVKYYTDCELEYKKGVKSIFDSRVDAMRHIQERQMAAAAPRPALPPGRIPGLSAVAGRVRPVIPVSGMKQPAVPPAGAAAGPPPRGGGNYTRRLTNRHFV